MIGLPAANFADDRGGVLVIVAVAMTSLVLIAAFVIDIANFYSHKRHLQLQADAAALAGARHLTIGGCSNNLIETGARTYGGSDSPDGVLIRQQPYNDQLGGTPASKVHILVNSENYWDGEDTSFTDGHPCDADKQYIDIKATESNLPWFFGFGGFVRTINAHARVALVQQSTANGTLPIAVPNPLPTSAAAIFINEGTGAILGIDALNHVPGSGTLDMWQTDPVSVLIQGPATGVVIALSGRPALSLTGTLTEICSQALTDCYDAGANPPTRGVSFIRGYSVSGSGTQPNPPKLRSVELFGTGCSPYFSDGTCTYDLVARIDAGVALPEADQIYTAKGVQLTASTDPNCAFVAGSDKCWHANLTLPAGTGPDDIGITWAETSGQLQIGNKLETCKTGGGNKCEGTFGVAQRAYSAKEANSGPMKLVEIFNCDDPSCAVPDRHSYPTGESHSFMVVVGISGTLRNATSTSDPIVALRVATQGGGGNTGHSLDCDPNYTNLKEELAKGCRPSYVPNLGSPDCALIGTSALWGSQQPWKCVAVNTGSSPNDVPAGLNERILLDDKANVCPLAGQNGHNNWALFDQNYVPTPGDTRGQDGFPIGDRRILNAYLTTYGAFSHVNGTSGSVPVVGFGHFYVTGWTGQGGGFNNPCQGNGDDPVPNNDSGLIVGHFIRYVDTLGGDGTLACDPNSINACVIVMTK